MELTHSEQFLSGALKYKLIEFISQAHGENDIQTFRDQIKHLSFNQKEVAYSLFLTKTDDIPFLSNPFLMMYMISF